MIDFAKLLIKQLDDYDQLLDIIDDTHIDEGGNYLFKGIYWIKV